MTKFGPGRGDILIQPASNFEEKIFFSLHFSEGQYAGETTSKLLDPI